MIKMKEFEIKIFIYHNNSDLNNSESKEMFWTDWKRYEDDKFDQGKLGNKNSK